jgi:hypothetical protein
MPIARASPAMRSPAGTHPQPLALRCPPTRPSKRCARAVMVTSLGQWTPSTTFMDAQKQGAICDRDIEKGGASTSWSRGHGGR